MTQDTTNLIARARKDGHDMALDGNMLYLDLASALEAMQAELVTCRNTAKINLSVAKHVVELQAENERLQKQVDGMAEVNAALILKDTAP